MIALLANLPVNGRKILMMLPKRDENIVLSTRNIPSAKVQHVSSINVVELLKHDCVIMSKETVRWIEMVFGEGLSAEEASQKIAAQWDEEVTETPEEVTANQEQESETEAPAEGGEE
jgi:large subunit ribosomal protein L4